MPEALIKSPLLLYQQRTLQVKSPVRLIEKSRQVGLTWILAFWAVIRAMKSENVSYAGYNLHMASEFIGDCAFWCDAINAAMTTLDLKDHMFIRQSRDHSVFSYKIELPRASITALTSKPETLRSRHGHVILDEAAFHPDLEGMRKAAGAFLIWGGTLTVVSTHNGFTSPFEAWIQDIREGKAKGVIQRITFKEAIADGLYKRICLLNQDTWSPEAEDEWSASQYDYYGDYADEELDVVPGKGRDGYIPVNAIEHAMRGDRPLIQLALKDSFTQLAEYEREQEITRWFYVEVAPYLRSLPKQNRHFLGCDFARSGDKTALAPLTEAEDITYDCPLIVELHNVPFEEQALVYFMLIELLPNVARVCLDSSGNGAWLAEKSYMRLGSTSQGITANAAHYQEYMPKFKGAFHSRHLRIPRHIDILHDLRSIKVDIMGTPKVPSNAHRKGLDGMQRHGDAAMALYMAWVATELGLLALATGEVKEPPRPKHQRRRGPMWSPA